MLLHAFHAAIVGLSLSWGALTPFTDPGKTDFDTALQVINPYGTWAKVNGQWAYTPLDHATPYTRGRWIYTEYGWYWKGTEPFSWVTEHYGYWTRTDGVWSWYPAPYWLPQIVEFRITSTHIGWRTAAVDRDGIFLESPEQRYAKSDEWSFVTLAQFTAPITPAVLAKPEEARAQLEDSTETRHTYVTYHEIDRPGPHPADFLSLCKDGGMFAPITVQDRIDQQRAAQQKAKEEGADAPSRSVKYWITMCLPNYWTPPPADAQSGQLYIYRPEFFQDEDGIARRVALWLNPDARALGLKNLGEALGSKNAASSKDDDANLTKSDPFRDTLAQSVHVEPSAPAPKKAPANGPAPIPLPVTNAAPTGP